MIISEIDGVVTLPAMCGREDKNYLGVKLSSSTAVVVGTLPSSVRLLSIYTATSNPQSIAQIPYAYTLNALCLDNIRLLEPVYFSHLLSRLTLTYVSYDGELVINSPSSKLSVIQCSDLKYTIKFNPWMTSLELEYSPHTPITLDTIPSTISFLTYINPLVDYTLTDIPRNIIYFATNVSLPPINGAAHQESGTFTPGSFGGATNTRYYYETKLSSTLDAFTMSIMLNQRDTTLELPQHAPFIYDRILHLKCYYQAKKKRTRKPLQRNFTQVNLAILCKNRHLPIELLRYLFTFLK